MAKISRVSFSEKLKIVSGFDKIHLKKDGNAGSTVNATENFARYIALEKPCGRIFQKN